MKKSLICSLFLTTAIFGGTQIGYAETNPAEPTYEQLVEQGIINPTEISKAEWTTMKAEQAAEEAKLNAEVAATPGGEENVLESGFKPKPGDILITNNTIFWGLTGHAAMVTDSSHVLEITGYGDTSSLKSYSAFISNNSKGSYWVQIYRPSNTTWAADAVRYGKANLQNKRYDISTSLFNFNPTYCSKLVWQSYYYGAGKSSTLNDNRSRIVFPYKLPKEISGVKKVKTFK